MINFYSPLNQKRNRLSPAKIVWRTRMELAYPALFSYRRPLMIARSTLLLVLLLPTASASIACATEKEPDSLQLTHFTETLKDHLVTFDMIALPGGSVEVPNPLPPRERIPVEVKPFWIGKHEVRWDEFAIFALGRDLEPVDMDAAIAAQARPSRVYGVIDRGHGFQGFPAIGMTYHAAQRYCEWLSQKTGHHYRLPTEAEWILACQEETDRPDIDTIAWHHGNSRDETQPVGTLAPNSHGLHDMLGNVAEWVMGADGKPVVMGGSFMDTAGKLTCTFRQKPTPDWHASDPQFPPSQWWLTDAPFVGLRVVREP
jgi:formylglycine-generating enzyme required for sulfatase activity